MSTWYYSVINYYNIKWIIPTLDPHDAECIAENQSIWRHSVDKAINSYKGRNQASSFNLFPPLNKYIEYGNSLIHPDYMLLIEINITFVS